MLNIHIIHTYINTYREAMTCILIRLHSEAHKHSEISNGTFESIRNFTMRTCDKKQINIHLLLGHRLHLLEHLTFFLFT